MHQGPSDLLLSSITDPLLPIPEVPNVKVHADEELALQTQEEKESTRANTVETFFFPENLTVRESCCFSFHQQQRFGFSFGFPDGRSWKRATWSYSTKLQQLFVSMGESFPIIVSTKEVQNC
jgi:hypothetical protein